MTKKSSARLARDAQREKLKDNTCWDDVNQIHKDCMSVLVKHQYILELSRNQELVNAVDDRKTLLDLIFSLGNDIRKLSEELAEIQKQHVGKTGGSQDPDEIMYAITIYEQYGLFIERHEATCVPTALHIGEIFDKAANKLEIIKLGQAIKKAQDLTDEERAELAKQQEVSNQLEEARNTGFGTPEQFTETAGQVIPSDLIQETALAKEIAAEPVEETPSEPTSEVSPAVEETAAVEQTIQR